MRTGSVAILLSVTVAAIGCGTTRMTDTTRAASEMMLISSAIDTAVAKLDFSELQGKRVYVDVQYLDGVVDRGYLISSLRQHLLAHGAVLFDDRKLATYIVEPRSGGVGTDKHSLLIGTPQMALPAVVPGVPSQIPEIALIKKTDQKGIAKIAVFAYNRANGQAVWQSGLVESNSTLKDTWVFGAGPISRGTIRPQTQLAGEEIPAVPSFPLPFMLFGDDEDAAPISPVQPLPIRSPELRRATLGAIGGGALAAGAGPVVPVSRDAAEPAPVVPASSHEEPDAPLPTPNP